jgi:hypothetical protein
VNTILKYSVESYAALLLDFLKAINVVAKNDEGSITGLQPIALSP